MTTTAFRCYFSFLFSQRTNAVPPGHLAPRLTASLNRAGNVALKADIKPAEVPQSLPLRAGTSSDAGRQRLHRPNLDKASQPTHAVRLTSVEASASRSASSAPVPNYTTAVNKETYAKDLGNYIRLKLLPEINRDGRPPLWLRPLAMVGAWFGFHGIGQTNCLSCACAVGATVKHAHFQGAAPLLRGGKLCDFSVLTGADLPGYLFDSVDSLMENLQSPKGRPGKGGDINVVLSVTRPRWRRMVGIAGHSSNLIRTGNLLHLVDAQKRIYLTADFNGDPAVLRATLARFIGPVANMSRCIRITDMGF